MKEHDEDDPVTSERAKAHGLRRIKRQHYHPQPPPRTAGEDVVTTRREGNYLIYETKPPDTNLPDIAEPDVVFLPEGVIRLAAVSEKELLASETDGSYWQRVRNATTTPPTTDTVLVSREEAAKVAAEVVRAKVTQLADDGISEGNWHELDALVHDVSIAVDALPPYTKEHVDG